MTDPHIEVKHPSEVYFQDLVHVFHITGSKLDMPMHIRIGAHNNNGDKINSYSDQVEAYEDWLKEMIAAQEPSVCQALETIYSKAQGAGVIITTICNPSPYFTHAHVVKDIIMELASD